MTTSEDFKAFRDRGFVIPMSLFALSIVGSSYAHYKYIKKDNLKISLTTTGLLLVSSFFVPKKYKYVPIMLAAGSIYPTMNILSSKYESNKKSSDAITSLLAMFSIIGLNYISIKEYHKYNKR